jgi:hypothetical protein
MYVAGAGCLLPCLVSPLPCMNIQKNWWLSCTRMQCWYTHCSCATVGPAACAAAAAAAGSDVTVVAKEAAMRPLRRLMAVLEPTVYSSSSTGSSNHSSSSKGNTSSSSSRSAAPAASSEQAALELGPVTAQDVAAALAATKPSAQVYEAQYQEFSTKYGQVV